MTKMIVNCCIVVIFLKHQRLRDIHNMGSVCDNESSLKEQKQPLFTHSKHFSCPINKSSWKKIVHPTDHAVQRGCPKHIATSSSTNYCYIAIESSYGLSIFNDTNASKNEQKKPSSSKTKSSALMSKWKLLSKKKMNYTWKYQQTWNSFSTAVLIHCSFVKAQLQTSVACVRLMHIFVICH